MSSAVQFYEKNEALPSKVGPYSIVRSLGRGGMGEVFLAKDPVCGRMVALKQIRPELRSNLVTQNRFLREAKVASKLSHPSIVPILSIQPEMPNIYYTMPFVEGDTLRQILRKPSEPEKIPALMRIFLAICEAIAYTHSKGILHRDLKPENIIIGKFGEVMILDWGIADFIDQKEESKERVVAIDQPDLTQPGKIAGTLAYMAPERLKGHSSSVQTDLYALGVMLYQILTLHLPFQRKTLASFRKMVTKEEILDPTEMAPHRDIPHSLAAICMRCLSREVEDRYPTATALIADLKNFIEGTPEWIFLDTLEMKKKEDWQFQEHILLAKHMAITQTLEMTEWARLMISKKPFSQNVRIQTDLLVKEKGQGVGFLLNVPIADASKSLEEGYCIWVHPHGCSLFRNNVLVLETQSVCLTPHTWHKVRIEKREDHLRVFVNQELKLQFTSYLPLAGAYIGLIHKDSQFELGKIAISDGSHNATLSCLAVPDAFLNHRFYDLALQEYRRIGHSFRGRLEGRDALFRAGLTLLEKGRQEEHAEEKKRFFEAALEEFEGLYKTSGAPLEYLGKSLVYAALLDSEEEAKCLELGLRKFFRHPLVQRLKDQVLFRIHESSLKDRTAAYRMIFLALRNTPDLLEKSDTKRLLENLQTHWEPLFFMEEHPDPTMNLTIQLAFWLANVPILLEIAENLVAQDPIDSTLLGNCLFALMELEAHQEVKNRFLKVSYGVPEIQLAFSQTSRPYPTQLNKKYCRAIDYWLRKGLKNSQFQELSCVFEKLKRCHMPSEAKLKFEALECWMYLLQKKYGQAKTVLETQKISSVLAKDHSPLHFVYGAWVYLSKGKQEGISHFSSCLETPYPSTTALPSLFLSGRWEEKHGWTERAFFWEKKELQRQIELFNRCVHL